MSNNGKSTVKKRAAKTATPKASARIVPPKGAVPPDSPPYISLCAICGDEGASVIERMLVSCLNRSTGPMFDEVSVYWNGSADKKPECLKRKTWETPYGFVIPMVVSDGPWRDDFAWARQISFEQAHGVWRCYSDSDDVFPPPDDPAVDEVLAGVNETRETSNTGSLREFIKQLSPAINAIRHLYNYTTIEGKAALQIPRIRIVRWADGWVWQVGVHEDMFPMAGTRVGLCHLSGLIIRHEPVQEGNERIERNRRILERLLVEKGGVETADHRTLYGLAAIHFDHSNDPEACVYLEKALAPGTLPAPGPPEVALYHTMLAQSYCRMGRTKEAIQHGFFATLAKADEPRGYLEVARALYHTGDYGNAIRWFREGFARVEGPGAGSLTLSPMAVKGQLRAIGAHALLAVGEYQEACAWAKMAAEADPGLFPERTLQVCQEALEDAAALAAFHTLGNHLLKRGELDRARMLVLAAPASVENNPSVWSLTETVAANEASAIMAAPVEVSETIRRSIGVPDGVEVVGPELARHLDPANLLAAVEETTPPGEDVHVVVQDGQWTTSPPPTGVRTRYTTPRLYRVLSARGKIRSLASIEPAATMEIGSDRHLYARYTPGMALGIRGRVAIWCPQFAQNWGPRSSELQGTGGSEEAVAYLSKEMSQRGYQVEVFAPLPQMDRPLCVVDGVLWRSLSEFDANTRWDNLILHRAPWGRQVTAFGAKRLWVWHHDHFYSDEHWNRRLASKACHLYVSNWQRRLLEGLLVKGASNVEATHKVDGTEDVFSGTMGVVIGNGIPPEQYEAAKRNLMATVAKGGQTTRHPHAVVYASMPTRGLDRLLDIWPDVREVVPDASLFFYYGMDTVRQLWRGHTADVLDYLTRLQKTMTALEPLGFVDRGRLGQIDLTGEFLQAGVMAYPTSFPEVYMISGVRAAAAGLRVVTTDAGCLDETLPDKTYMVRGAASDEQWHNGGREVFKAMLIKALLDPEAAYDRERVARETLERCSWGKVAERVIAAFEAADAGMPDIFTPADAPFQDLLVPTKTVARVPRDPSLRRAMENESSLRIA